MKNFIQSWRLFLTTVFEPTTFILLVAIGFLFNQSVGPESQPVSSMLFVMITVTSALLGGRITKKWVDVTEGGVVVARGKSAVRGLKLLLRNIAALESRIETFRNAENDIKERPEVTKRNYEEVMEICSLLQEETVNSIENWTDIVPEADIKTHIGVISELRTTLAEKKLELTQLEGQFEATKGESEQEKKGLKIQIQKKENKIAELERKIVFEKMDYSGIAAADALARINFPAAGVSLHNPNTPRSYRRPKKFDFEFDKDLVVSKKKRKKSE